MTMYDIVYNMIEKELRKKHGYTSDYMNTMIYFLLLYIKYLCDKKEKNFNYPSIIQMENINPLLSLLPEEKIIKDYYEKRLKDTAVHKILATIQYNDIKELVLEFLEKQRDSVSLFPAFCEHDSSIVYLWTDDNFANYDVIHPNVTYVMESYVSRVNYYSEFQLLDEMLGFQRTYVDKLSDVALENVDVLFIHDMVPIYRFSKNVKGIVESLEDILQKNCKTIKRVVLQVAYRKIAIFSSNYLLKHWLSKVVFFQDNKMPDVYMEFQFLNLMENKDKQISLLLLDEKTEKDIPKLKKILQANRNKKDTLIKIKTDDVLENNHRIGFKMYALDNKLEIKEINDIIDENTELIQSLEQLNKKIAEEVNKLIVK